MKTTKLLTLVATLAISLPSTTYVSSIFIKDSIAGSTSTTMTVSAQVVSNCNFSGGSVTLTFGTYDPIGANATANLDATTTFDIRCTKGTTAILSMNNGINADGAQRRLTDSNSSYLNYQIYTDAARSTIWNLSNTVTYLAQNSSPATVSVYGQIPAGQSDITAGNYTDTVTITANY